MPIEEEENEEENDRQLGGRRGGGGFIRSCKTEQQKPDDYLQSLGTKANLHRPHRFNAEDVLVINNVSLQAQCCLHETLRNNKGIPCILRADIKAGVVGRCGVVACACNPAYNGSYKLIKPRTQVRN